MLSSFCWFDSCSSFLIISESSVRSVGYAGHEGMVGHIKSAGHIRSVGSHWFSWRANNVSGLVDFIWSFLREPFLCKHFRAGRYLLSDKLRSLGDRF